MEHGTSLAVLQFFAELEKHTKHMADPVNVLIATLTYSYPYYLLFPSTVTHTRVLHVMQ